MNLFLAWIILSILFFVWIKPVGINTIIPTEIPSKILPTVDYSIQEWLIIEKEWILLFPLSQSIAENQGIQQGDILLEINGVVIEYVGMLQKMISENANTEMIFFVQRGNMYMDVFITPNNEGKIGSYLAPNYEVNEDFIYQYSLWNALISWFQETYSQTRLTLSGLWLLAQKVFLPKNPEEREEALSQVSWPIGIVHVITESLSSWIKFLLILTAIISINLAVFNLLPIPALDGGRLLLLWIKAIFEKIFWKKHSFSIFENSIHITFFILLIAISILIAYNDIIRIIWN